MKMFKNKGYVYFLKTILSVNQKKEIVRFFLSL